MASQKVILVFTLIFFLNRNLLFCMSGDLYSFGKEAVPIGKDPSTLGFVSVKTEEILTGWHEKNGLKIVAPSSFGTYVYGFLFLDNGGVKVAFGDDKDKTYLIRNGSELILNCMWFIHSSWGVFENTIWGRIYNPDSQTGYYKEAQKLLQA